MARPASKKKSSARSPAGPTRGPLALAAALFSLWLLSLFEPQLWLGAAARELGFHLFLVGLLAGVAVLAARLWLPGALLLAVGAALAWPMVPLYRGALRTPQRGPVLRIATAHLAGAALDELSLLGFLGRERPDALALTGLRSNALGARAGSYRVVRGTGYAHTVLLVQSALLMAPLRRASTYPSQVVRAGRCQARLVAVELPKLLDYGAVSARTQALATLAHEPSAQRSVWLGMLGSRAEARDLRAFMAQHELRDSRPGHGRVATAPSALGPLGLPLSHVLVHGWISVRELSAAAPLVEGAHRTVAAVLELTEARCRFDRASATE